MRSSINTEKQKRGSKKEGLVTGKEKNEQMAECA